MILVCIGGVFMGFGLRGIIDSLRK